MTRVPAVRIRAVNDAAVDPDGDVVVYWMVAYRRLDWNFALQRAVERARELDRPLLILEPLRCDHRWASDRLHRFVLDGMADNARRLRGARAAYYPYVEPEAGAGRGLLEAIAGPACLVVTDDYPSYFLPRMIAAAGSRLGVRLEAVDSNGILPLAACDRSFARAHDLRRYLQRHLRPWLERFPRPHPLRGSPLPELGSLPAGVTDRWPPAEPTRMEGEEVLAELPIDHDVPPVPHRGGASGAEAALTRFVDEGLDRYAEEARRPEAEATSGLSPWLHFGHVSAHRVFRTVTDAVGWTVDDLGEEADGRRSGWWGAGEDVESFLDQVITWRELGFLASWHGDAVGEYEGIPGWARKTLEEHAGDPRPRLYDEETLEQGETGDELWNAAQGQLLTEGRIHGYLRMLWGKKILEWTPDPRRALEVMIRLNERWAVDGRDPNSYSGISWVLGRYDRAWGPERPVFGKVRYMTSESAARKFSVDGYVRRYAPDGTSRSP